jgi:hypothetical protein
MLLVTSVGLARPSSVRIGLEATGSFKPHEAETGTNTKGIIERNKPIAPGISPIHTLTSSYKP